jgi:hypothetical protein
MPRRKMHPDEVLTNPELVRRLLADQFPRWAALPLALVDSYGTDHDIYRLGDDLCVRLPRIGWAADQAAKEGRWLPKLAPHLPLALPVQVAVGHPTDGYPFEWSVYEWLPGENANDTIADLDRAAADLASFVTALRAIDTSEAATRPRGARGAPLAELDEAARGATAQLADRVDSGRCCVHGRSRSMRRPGATTASGCTATCCRAISSSSMAGSPRSSTSAVFRSGTRHATCNPCGISSLAPVALAIERSWTSTMRRGFAGVGGRSFRP